MAEHQEYGQNAGGGNDAEGRQADQKKAHGAKYPVMEPWIIPNPETAR
jgi:hypothetical protein